MHQLVIASNNQGKIRELEPLLTHIQLFSLADIGFESEIPEPYFTFEENALTKAETVQAFCRKNTFSEDSGLCVNALNGAPGVISAHYSGHRNDEQNLQQVLQEMEAKEDRSAFYKAVICLIWDGEVYYFEGICEGTIAFGKSGTGGFGYDPIFIPLGYDQTFGDLPMEVKSKISHRSKAVGKMIAFLNTIPTL